MTACGSSDPQPESSPQPEITPEPIEERKYNYLTGEELAFEELATMRPVAVMVDSSKYAMPQSGLAAADIIYEMVTEGGITRLMAVFSDIDKVEDVGPVRSARDQFVQFMLPLNAIYVHIGTSIYANDMLNFYHYQDIDGLYLGGSSFEFSSERAAKYAHEHCWYTDDGMIEEGMRKTGISINGNLYPAFNFADYREAPVVLENGLPATEIDFNFSDYADIDFDYDAESNRYYKKIFGIKQEDESADEQLSFQNVLLLYTKIAPYPDGLCMAFDLSKGDGFYFYGGRYIPVKWIKGQPEDPLQIFDLNGEPVEINVGKTYVGVIGNDMLKTLEIDDVYLISEETDDAREAVESAKTEESAKPEETEESVKTEETDTDSENADSE